MKFVSTRDTAKKGVTADTAILMGLAPDGGLFLPDELPTMTKDEFESLKDLSYEVRAKEVLKRFLLTFPEDGILSDTTNAYSPVKFGGHPAPVVKLDNEYSVLELFHGPTCAFKDMALQLLPYLMVRAKSIQKNEQTVSILVATSGDTGKAALEGFRDVPGTTIQVFYPTDGVSKMQKRQMQTQEGQNVSVCAIRGNFDDAQNGVKELFQDKSLAEELAKSKIELSSANSINFGRLVPQVVYYISAYLDMVKSGSISYGDTLDICVPTGNFGNIFAAYIAKKMGLPLGKLVCASNQNDVLTEFLTTGTYNRNRPFYKSISPSMDILISSNLERLLFVEFGSDITANYMRLLKTEGKYTLTSEELKKIQAHFVGFSANEEETKKGIKDAYTTYNYLIDPHTSVAYMAAKEYKKSTGSQNPMLVVSTASPYKFTPAVAEALDLPVSLDDMTLLKTVSEATNTTVPASLLALFDKEVRFEEIIASSEMKDAVLNFLVK